jgi:hypothetical protein
MCILEILLFIIVVILIILNINLVFNNKENFQQSSNSNDNWINSPKKDKIDITLNNITDFKNTILNVDGSDNNNTSTNINIDSFKQASPVSPVSPVSQASQESPVSQASQESQESQASPVSQASQESQESRFKSLVLYEESNININLENTDTNKYKIFTLAFYYKLRIDNEDISDSPAYRNGTEFIILKSNDDLSGVVCKIQYEIDAIVINIYDLSDSYVIGSKAKITFNNIYQTKYNFISIKYKSDKITINSNGIEQDYKFTKTYGKIKNIVIGDNKIYVGKLILRDNIIKTSVLCKAYNCDHYLDYNKNCFKLDPKYNYYGENGSNDPIKTCVSHCVSNCDINKKCCESNKQKKLFITNNQTFQSSETNQNITENINICEKYNDNDSCKTLLKKCQQICVDCENIGEITTIEQKKSQCSWYDKIKILDKNKPDPPSIRGFPGDGSILIEWKAPFNGRVPITYYIISYYETFNKDHGVKIKVIGKNDDKNLCTICESEILNLKKQTHYDITIRAANNMGLSDESNIETIETTGINDFNNMSNIFSELDPEEDDELVEISRYQCNSSENHILDNINTNDIDLKKYINLLKKK